MAKKYVVTLQAQEREELTRLTSVGKAAARKLTHVSVKTVERVRQRFVEQGLEAALVPAKSTRVYERKLDGKQEAQLIALACSAPPAGKKRWTLRLLADELVELEVADSVSHETVRQTLKKTRSSRT